MNEQKYCRVCGNKISEFEYAFNKGMCYTCSQNKYNEELADRLKENEEIETCFERFTICKTSDVMNFSYADTLAYIERLKAENAELRARLERAVELPCKVGDKVYGVGFTDCEDSRTTDEKKKRQIFNVCMKMGGNCEKCKYRRPQIEEFVCTHIQLGDCGIEGKSILIVGDRNENYTANNVFTASEAAEARLAELKGEKKNG